MPAPLDTSPLIFLDYARQRGGIDVTVGHAESRLHPEVAC